MQSVITHNVRWKQYLEIDSASEWFYMVLIMHFLQRDRKWRRRLIALFLQCAFCINQIYQTTEWSESNCLMMCGTPQIYLYSALWNSPCLYIFFMPHSSRAGDYLFKGTANHFRKLLNIISENDFRVWKHFILFANHMHSAGRD